MVQNMTAPREGRNEFGNVYYRYELHLVLLTGDEGKGIGLASNTRPLQTWPLP